MVLSEDINRPGLPLKADPIAPAHKAPGGRNPRIVKGLRQPAQPCGLGKGIVVYEGNDFPRGSRQSVFARVVDVRVF